MGLLDQVKENILRIQQGFRDIPASARLLQESPDEFYKYSKQSFQGTRVPEPIQNFAIQQATNVARGVGGVQTAMDKTKSVTQRALGVAQTAATPFMFTPTMMAANYGQSAVAGKIKGLPLTEGAGRDMALSEGLGVTNPYIALGIDVLGAGATDPSSYKSLAGFASKSATNVFKAKNDALKQTIATLEKKMGQLEQSGAGKVAIRKTSQAIDKAYKEIAQNRVKASKLGMNAGLVGEEVSRSRIPEVVAQPEIQDPVQKVIAALKEAKPVRGKQEEVYSKIRSQQAARVAKMGSKVPGEKGYFAQLGQLKGEMPKVSFEGIRNQLTQPDIDSLFNQVEGHHILTPFEKVTAKTGLAKLLGSEGGVVPTQGELKLLQEVFPPEFVQAALEKRPLLQKLTGAAVNALNIPRSIMATADLSAPLRQGIFLVGRPKQWGPAFRDMFKYAFSEKAYEGLLQDIQTRPTYPLMRENKLALTDLGKQLSSREEAFMSTLPERLPVFGSISKGSSRAYTGFLNKLRADTFDDMYKQAAKVGVLKDNPKVVSDIANFVNTATGRGGLGKFERAAEVLNATLFSPRLVASRVQLLNPAYYVGLDPFVRKEALKSLVSFVGLGTTVLGLSKLAGAQVGVDPTNSDFGKIKVGNTRYDIWGGFQQYIKLASQLVSGQITSSTTGKTMTLGEGYKPLTRKDILMRFLESKESPVASFITALASGQTGTGEPVNIPAEVISRFIPMIAQDMADLYEEHGPEGIAMGVPGAFGVGSQTYGKTEFVTGTNKIGMGMAEIRPTQDLPTRMAEKAFGPAPVSPTSSWNAEAYYNQLLKLPKEQAASEFDRISKLNPDLAKKMIDIAAQRKKGVTVQDEVLKAKGVASGDRAAAIAKEFGRLKTKEDKARLWEAYVQKGIITKEVATQLKELLKENQ